MLRVFKTLEQPVTVLWC